MNCCCSATGIYFKSSGGGTTDAQVFHGDYAGIAPEFSPTESSAIAFDTSTGPPMVMWVWDGVSWA